MLRSIRRLASLLPLALLLAACSSDDTPTDPDPPGPPVAQPAAVSDLAVTGATSESITLSWTTPGVPDDDRPLAAYDLRRAPFGAEPADRDQWTPVSLDAPADPGTPAAVTVDGMAALSTWVFRLRSRGAGEWSADGPWVVATADPQWDRTPPAAITDLELRWRSDDELFVTWGATGGDGTYGEPAAYEVRRADSVIDAGNWDQAVAGPAPVHDDAFDRWTCHLTGLAADATVYVAVRAVDDTGNWSDVSNDVVAEPPSGSVWHVHADGTGTVPTIGEAIVQAGYRDLILLHPGRYTWTNQGGPMHDLGLIFVGRDTTDFTLASALGPESTILDAEGQGCVIFIQGYNDGVVIEGLTITGGAVTTAGDDEYPLAGGLTYHLTSPTVRDCIFEDNHGGQGGAIGYFGVGTPTIEGCIIRDNHADHHGGGIYAVNVHGPGGDTEHGIEIIDCVIENNTCDGSGGGIAFVNAVARVEGCVITGNGAAGSGGGLIAAGRAIDDGADTWVDVSNTTIADNMSPLGAAVRTSIAQSLDGTETRHGHARLVSCIVAGHAGVYWFSSYASTVLAVGCSALYDEGDEGVPPLPFTDLGDNFWADPLFCGDGATDPWTLSAASPCLPGAHPDGADCGRVGARDAGCP